MGDHLVINGDLFEFWFEYRTVIPRAAFGTLERLAALRRAGVQLTVIGGNHDRWGGGGTFWRENLGAAFFRGQATLELAGLRAVVAHGDGLTETRFLARLFHRAVGHPLTEFMFRWIHPDLGIRLVGGLSPYLGGKVRTPQQLERAHDGQRAYAEQFLRTAPDVDLLVLSHTHRAAVTPMANRKWFLNPGAFENGEFALVTDTGPELRHFDGTC